MELAALLTSAAINTGLCTVFLLMYSILRKQPGNARVYFGRRLAQAKFKSWRCSPVLERIVPSTSWILKAWRCGEDEILAVAGLDAVVFLRILVFSIRIFTIAALVCIFGVLPLNYFGQERQHRQFPSKSLDVYTIANIKEGSHMLWVHCLALYVISYSACILLYFEYKSILKMRLAHITASSPNPSHFSVLVRAIPQTIVGSLSDTVKDFFTKYHGASYLSHQMVYRTGILHKLMSNAEKVYEKLVRLKVTTFDQNYRPSMYRCSSCGGTSASFQLYHNEYELIAGKSSINCSDSSTKEKEFCSAAFVFFKTRYAAVVASQVIQSSNPLLWVIDLAPEPHDVYWSNLWIPYRQLWIRRIATLMVSVVFMVFFLIPVAFVQGLSQLDQLQEKFPFLDGILKRKFMSQIVTGYLPSVVLQLFLYTVPPIMMILSAVEGSISRSGRKRSACYKVLYFTIWNVFFVNVFSGSLISQLNAISTPKGILTRLAKLVPGQATFFITYVLTSGWAALSFELVQFFPLVCNIANKLVFQSDIDLDSVPSFPFHIEVPKVLLFGLLGFTCSILAPLILPFLLVNFLLGYVVYCNQILNVYCSKYETGGQIWPMVHNTTVFSLVLAQVIALGVFAVKHSPVAFGFTILLVICTLLFNEYCRQRFHPLFKTLPAKDIIDKDKQDEECGRLEEIRETLHSAYCQVPPDMNHIAICEDLVEKGSEDDDCSIMGEMHPNLGLPFREFPLGLDAGNLYEGESSMSAEIIGCSQEFLVP